MRINFENNKTTFSALGSRPLKGIFMTSGLNGIADEISSLTPKTGLNVYSLDSHNNIISENFRKEGNPKITWAQDLFAFIDNKLLVDTFMNPETKDILDIASHLCDYFGLKYEPHSYNLQGGNFILNDVDGVRDVFVGKYDIQDMQALGIKDLAKRLDADNVYEISQVAAHLDVFMFVDGKRVFICDDKMMIDEIDNAIHNVEKAMYSRKIAYNEKNAKLCMDLRNLKQRFASCAMSSPYASAQDAMRAVERAGYEPIRIPGRVYSLAKFGYYLQHQYETNFANAILHKNSDGDTILLTNESANDVSLGLDKTMEENINFSFKKIFLDAISPYIKRENVYFIKGNDNEILRRFKALGGLNCSAAGIM